MASLTDDDVNAATRTLKCDGPFDVLRLAPGVYEPVEIKRCVFSPCSTNIAVRAATSGSDCARLCLPDSRIAYELMVRGWRVGKP